MTKKKHIKLEDRELPTFEDMIGIDDYNTAVAVIEAMPDDDMMSKKIINMLYFKDKSKKTSITNYKMLAQALKSEKASDAYILLKRIRVAVKLHSRRFLRHNNVDADSRR